MPAATAVVAEPDRASGNLVADALAQAGLQATRCENGVHVVDLQKLERAARGALTRRTSDA